MHEAAGPAGLKSLLLAMVLLAANTSCASPQEQNRNAEAPYRSVWAELFPDTLPTRDSPGTLAGDFHMAADAGSVGQAQTLWAAFLKRHEPPDGFYEDAMHARLCEWARMEVQRLNYLISGDDDAAASQTAKMRRMAPG